MNFCYCFIRFCHFVDDVFLEEKKENGYKVVVYARYMWDVESAFLFRLEIDWKN